MQRSLFMVVSMLAIVLGLFTGRANARPNITCSGSGCNGVDPYNSGCTAVTKAFTQKDGSAGSGTVQSDLRWSSVCASKWARATNIYPGVIRKLSARLTDNSLTYLNVEPTYASSDYGQVWTNMHAGVKNNGTNLILCAIAQQGKVGYSYDAITGPACY
ncbi:MAG: hypothetical protein IT310_13535 [Anaerolineales bacterium]|nr:hypothetical protein [Anaerolineales bacterium]